MRVRLDIELTFDDDGSAKEFAVAFKRTLKKNVYFLELTVYAMLGTEVEDRDWYLDHGYIVKGTKRSKNKFSIQAMNKKPNDDLKELARIISKLGAARTKLLEVRGNGKGDEVYMHGHQFVERSEYEKKELGHSADELEGSDMFLPDGRVEVEAKLLSFKSDSDKGYVILMRFETSEGKKFSYRGSSEVFGDLLEAGCGSICRFWAGFELKKYKGKFTSMALRPSRLRLMEIEPTQP